jgi:ATP-dependent DNA ligase
MIMEARRAGENGRVLLGRVAEVSREVGATSARLTKVELLAGALREAGPAEVPIAVAYLSGELPQRQIGVGWAALRDGFPPADVPTLSLSEVDAGFSAIGAVSGKGSAAERKALVGELFGRATADEQCFLFGLLSGELRQGALEGVMTDAVARAASVPVADVRRAMMLCGSLAAVATAALAGGSAGRIEDQERLDVSRKDVSVSAPAFGVSSHHARNVKKPLVTFIGMVSNRAFYQVG